MKWLRHAVHERAALLWRRMFLARTFAEVGVGDREQNRAEMKKELNAFDATLFGVGAIIGAGVFVITGVAAKEHAGPAVVVSYVISSVAALLSALAYSEFAVELPVAGGAFSYILVTFGELSAYLTCSNLLLEYLLSGAAVARGFTSYFATLCGRGPSDLRVGRLDPLAVLLIALLVALICYGTKGSSWFNIGVTGASLLVILFIIAAGLAKGSAKNVTADFAPFGARGVVDAAALIFFSYIGFDSVSTLAEEVRRPGIDLPVGMIGSVLICGILYVLLCFALTLMVPYAEINVDAPFSVAFDVVAGWHFARYVVAAGAVMGIVTSLLVSLIGSARVVLVMARAHLVPARLAEVNLRTGTPVVASVTLGAACAAISFATSLENLTSMVSIGTLITFLMVAAALLFKRHHLPGQTSARPVLLHLGAITVAACGLTMTYQLTRSVVGPSIFGLLWFLSTLSLQVYVPQVRLPPDFRVPLMPWPASASMLLNVFLLGTLDYLSYVRFAVWTLAALLLYIFYGVSSASRADSRGPLTQSLAAQDAVLNYVQLEQLPRESFDNSLLGTPEGSRMVPTQLGTAAPHVARPIDSEPESGGRDLVSPGESRDGILDYTAGDLRPSEVLSQGKDSGDLI